MTWIWIAFIGLGVLMVGSGLLTILWAAFEMVLLLFRRDDWRDHPDLEESLRRPRQRRRDR